MSNVKRIEKDKASVARSAVWAALSFAVPCAVMTALMTVCGIAPFGDGTLINPSDSAWFQSFSDMYRSVVSGEGIFYHLNVGFGSSFYHEFASGLCSPFMFLSLFFGQRSLASAFTFITIARAGAAGAAMWYMLRKCAEADAAMSFALSCGYSLCGFTAFGAYYPSVGDGAVFFPLLVAGIYSFVQASRPVRLFVFGVLFFVTCQRLTLIGLLFSVAVYAAFYNRRGSKRQRIYKTALFAATLLCSAVTNAALVLPVWSGSVYYKNGVFSDVARNDILSDLCFGGYGTTPSGGMGLCLAGLLIIGFFAFFFNDRISWGEKISVFSGAALVVLCHAVPVLSKYFFGFGNSGGEKINAGFMLALLAVYCTARSCILRDGLKTWGIAASVGLYALIAVLSAAFGGGEIYALMAEAGLAVLSCAVFVQITVGGGRMSLRLPAAAAAGLILFGAVHTAGAVGRMESVVTAERLSYIASCRIEAREQLEERYRQVNEEVPRFYRTRGTDGVSDSVDIRRNQVDGLTEFAERLGIMRASEYGGADNFTEFTDALFGIAGSDYGYVSDEDLLRSICSPAYLTGNWDGELPEGMNAFGLQNYLAEQWFGVVPFREIQPTETAHELSSENERYRWTFGNSDTQVFRYTFRPEEQDNLYLLVEGIDFSYAVDSDSRSNWHEACADGVFNISQYRTSEGDEVTLYISTPVSIGEISPVFMAYSGALDEIARTVGARYISHRGNTVRFMFSTSRSQLAITSLPYESGWEITVNGKKAKPVELCGGLTGMRLEAGNNSVVMNYTPPFFRASMWISAVMFVFGLYLTLKIEHEAARRRKVRMAFRAVELNISRMTPDQLGEKGGEAGGNDGGVDDVESAVSADQPQEQNDRESADAAPPETSGEETAVPETETGSETDKGGDENA